MREGENLTGLAAIQALMPICLSSFTAELAFSGAIFQAMRDTVFSLSLPPLMQPCRVNVAGSRGCVFRGRGERGPPTVITAVRLHRHLHVCSRVSPPVSTSRDIWVKTLGRRCAPPQWKSKGNSSKDGCSRTKPFLRHSMRLLGKWKTTE